ncbi:MAG: hypothetical protein ACOX6T_10425 [Myxococcales bacterium]|jgi:hypothetical protein
MYERAAALAMIVALHAAAAGCSTPAPKPEAPHHPQADVEGTASIVPGEALIRMDGTPDPQELANQAGVEGLVVLECAHVFGKVYQVRFARAGGEQADERFTQRVVEAFERVKGILSSEPNSKAQAKHPQSNR